MGRCRHICLPSYSAFTAWCDKTRGVPSVARDGHGHLANPQTEPAFQKSPMIRDGILSLAMSSWAMMRAP